MNHASDYGFSIEGQLPGPTTKPNEHERKAVGLYAVLAYDWSDFFEMCDEASNEALTLLYQMLRLPNSKHSADTRELNRVGGDMVERLLKNRGVPLPEIPTPAST